MIKLKQIYVIKLSISQALNVLIFALSYSSLLQSANASKTDISCMPSLNSSTSQRVFLISFGHGELHERNQNYLAMSAINKGIDIILLYRKRHIDPSFYEQNKAILDAEMGAGYWLWKPYFILETLKLMSPNDILIYLDAGAYIKHPVFPFLDMVNKPETNILLFENYCDNTKWVKRDTFDIMEMDYSYRSAMQLEGGFLVIKNTPTSVKFIQSWLTYCSIGQAINDEPSNAPEFPEFVQHRHDQSILTLVRIKFADPTIKVIKREDSNIFVLHHRRDKYLPLSQSWPI